MKKIMDIKSLKPVIQEMISEQKKEQGRKQAWNNIQSNVFNNLDKIRNGEASSKVMSDLDALTTATWQVSGFNSKDMAGRGAYYIAELINSGFSRLKQIASKPEKSEPDEDGTVTIQGRGDFQEAVRDIFDAFRLKKYATGAIYFLSWIAFGPAAAFFGKIAPGVFGAVQVATKAAPPVGKVAQALNISKGATYKLTKRQMGAGIGASIVAPGLAGDAAVGAEKVVSEQDNPFESEKVADDYGLSMKNAPGWDAGGVVNFMQDLFGITKSLDAFMESFDSDALLAQKRLGNALYLIFIRNDVKTENDAYNKVIELFKGLSENIKTPSKPLVKPENMPQSSSETLASAEEDIFAEEEYDEDDIPGGEGELLAVFE